MTDVTSTQGPGAARTSASGAARNRAKEAVRAELREVARRHIAERGAADLSLRAVARELSMTSSAVYRFVTSREALIASLVVESYEAVADVAERADREQAGIGADAASRWLGVARAIRGWALQHPHEYQLIYGTHAPAGAPATAVGPAAARIWRVVAGVMATAVATGVLHPPTRAFDVEGLIARHVVASVGQPVAPFRDFIVRGMALFSSLIGVISSELSGQFGTMADDDDRLFDVLVAVGAQGAGLDLPVGFEDGLSARLG